MTGKDNVVEKAQIRKREEEEEKKERKSEVLQVSLGAQVWAGDR